MPPDRFPSLSRALEASSTCGGSSFSDAQATGSLREWSSAARSRYEAYAGKSVLLRTTGQLEAAKALVGLDGVARRIVICTPDLSQQHAGYVIETAEVDAVVTDDPSLLEGLPALTLRTQITASVNVPETEWILLTSGTTGAPKLVRHTLSSLTHAIAAKPHSRPQTVWATFYDIRRFGGLQILLRAILSGCSMVFSDERESVGDFFLRAAQAGVTHISGTPSHWRHALMSPLAQRISPTYVRLSGEVVDRTILHQLPAAYPEARIVHAFASTEAGVVFEVHDCEAGFPAAVLSSTPGVEIEVREGTLHVRSQRTASCYLGKTAARLRGEDGYVDTGDVVELRSNRYFFSGRRDHVMKVGGLKVHPEEIEEVLNRHPRVKVSLVRAKKNPVTGSLVAADVVLREESPAAPGDLNAVREEIRVFCREVLSAHKVPVVINVVSALPIASSGKVLRQNA